MLEDPREASIRQAAANIHFKVIKPIVANLTNRLVVISLFLILITLSVIHSLPLHSRCSAINLSTGISVGYATSEMVRKSHSTPNHATLVFSEEAR